jgi:hypothetical protein
MTTFLLTRGCAPHGFVRETRSPRGPKAVRARIVNGPKRSNVIETPGGIKVSGTLARQLMTVKTGSCKHRREFARFCSRFGIRYTIPHDVTVGDKWGHRTVVEVVGMAPALAKLSELDCVIDSVDPLDVRPPRLTASTFRRDPY